MGPADPGDALPVSITLQLQYRGALDALIAEQQRPGSAAYHRWLTPEEFTARFAPPAPAYDELADWLRQEGVAVTPSPSRLRIDFTGTVAQVERSFQVHMNRYHYAGREALAAADSPTVPARFADLVRSARLNTFPLAHPLTQVTVLDQLTDTMAPSDMYTAYGMNPVLATGIDGRGQTIAVVARSDFELSDVSTFQSEFGVPVRAPTKVFPDGNPGIGSPNSACAGINNAAKRQSCILDEETEVALDTEWAGAMAPGAAVLVDISNADIDLSLLDIVNHHPEAKIVTLSFGVCERLDPSVVETMQPLYAQAATQGQTVLVATGDDGPDECMDGKGASVNAFASDPNVTAVGGTSLDPGFDGSGTATRYVDETVWNDDGASGGGVSTLVAKPSYQNGPGVPADGFRDQPDVALLASPLHSGYVIAVESQLTIIGGTSASAPSWAGIVALLNQAAAANGLGAINDSLYQFARQQYADGGPAVFHDVTIGNTTFDHVTGYAAGVGFDLATGWGAPNVELLVQAFAPASPTPSPSPTPVLTVLPCVGDCDGNGVVSVAELIKGVDIFLGLERAGDCPATECNGSALVAVDCLIQAVNAALNGCGPVTR